MSSSVRSNSRSARDARSFIRTEECPRCAEPGALDLPEAQREVAVLKLVRGARFAEIGEMLGVSEAAARMRFVRALEALRGPRAGGSRAMIMRDPEVVGLLRDEPGCAGDRCHGRPGRSGEFRFLDRLSAGARDRRCEARRRDTIHGHDVYWLRFPSFEQGREGTEVAIDRQTYKPVVIRNSVPAAITRTCARSSPRRSRTARRTSSASARSSSAT